MSAVARHAASDDDGGRAPATGGLRGSDPVLQTEPHRTTRPTAPTSTGVRLLDARCPLGRLARLLDPGSLDARPGASGQCVRVVRGRVDGAAVVAFCTDGATMGGALGRVDCEAIAAATDLALAEGVPVLGVWHCGGARLPDGVDALHGVGTMFTAMTRASGRVPQISVIVGPAAGAAAYGPALTDLVVMAPAGRVFITGPEIVRSVTGEEIDMAGLGGADAQARRSGVVHITTASEDEAYAITRRLTGYFTTPGRFDPRAAADERDPGAALPDSSRRAYDMRPIVRDILDPACGDAAFTELQARWAPNVVVGLGRLTGRAVGVVANNPLRKGGCLDTVSAEKASRFVRMCDAFGVPLLVLVDVPGFLPGVGQEWDGVVRRGAKLLHAFAEAVVPRVTVVVRKSYGGAYVAMNSKAVGASRVLAWPQAEIAVMSAQAAVEVLYRKQLAAAPDADRDSLQARLSAEQAERAGGLDRATALGIVDEVVTPHRTRERITAAFADAAQLRGRHGNIPL